jgi:DNA-binding NarL/FixJ family response regulator
MKQNQVKTPPLSVIKSEDYVEVSINVPIKFKLPCTAANHKFLIVFLRMLTQPDGLRLLTYHKIAELLGYDDRRNVNNFWRELEEHDGDLLAYLSRKVDLVECIPVLEAFVADNLLLPVAEMHRKFTQTTNYDMSIETFKKYLSQTNSLNLLKHAQKLLLQKVTGSGAVEILRLLADQHNVPALCDRILEKAEAKKESPKPVSEMKSTLSRRNLCLLVHYLVASGLNLKTIALLLNVSKTTVFNLWHEITDMPSMILNSIGKWSGKISIDEKYIKIKGIPHFVITIVDFVTGIPLYMNVYPNATKESYEECFLTFKHYYKKTPRLIVSDGSYALKAGRLAVFPSVPHQLCKFHKIKNLFAKISSCYLPKDEELWLKGKVVKAFRRVTVSGRKKALRELMTILPKPAADYVRSNIIKQWPNLSKSLTSNVSERFNRKIMKVMSGRYGLKSYDTAVNLANSLWMKELIDNGKFILHDDSLIASLNISQICQENLAWNHLDLLFSKKTGKAA